MKHEVILDIIKVELKQLIGIDLITSVCKCAG